jgi:hypothetical protein
MKRNVFNIVSVLVLAAFAGSTNVEAQSYSEKTIGICSGDHYKIEDNIIVWCPYRSTCNIFDGINTTQINPDYAERLMWNEDYGISEGRIVFAGIGRAPEYYGVMGIYLYDIFQGGKPQLLSYRSDDETSPYFTQSASVPDIHNNKAVWTAYTEPWSGTEDGDYKIWISDLSGNPPATELLDPSTLYDGYEYYYPKINNDQVVCTICGENGEYKIALFENGSFKNISHSDYSNNYFPQIHNGIAVWFGFNSEGTQVIYYDYNSDIPLPTVINSASSNNGYPQIYDGKVVFVGYEGSNKEIYIFDIAKGEGPINISNNPNLDDKPWIHGNKVVWYGYDGNDYEIYLYDIEKGETVQVTDNERNDYDPKIHEDQIIYRSYVGGSWVLNQASPKKELIITNIGDGESIRLKWTRYTDEEAVYRVWRKEETKTIQEGEDWKNYYDSVETSQGYDYIVDNDEKEYVEFIDTKKKDDPDDQSHPNYKGPKRGVVYDYIIEVLKENTKEPIEDALIGPKKGVSEPFIMLMRGYGEDDESYWDDFKEDLRNL